MTDIDLSGRSLVLVTSVPFFFVTQLKSFADAVVAAGACVTVVCSPGPELAEVVWSERLRHVPLPIARKPAPWADLRALLVLTRLLSRLRPDIVHSTTPKAGLLAMLAARWAGVPVRLHTFTGQPWVTLQGPLRTLSRLADRLIGRTATFTYADSPSQRAFLVAEGILSDARVGVVGIGSLAGVDTDRFDAARFSDHAREALRTQCGLGDAAPVVLYVGRVTSDKGIAELLVAFREVRDTLPRAALVIVGPDEMGLLASAPPEGVHLLGYQPAPERFFAIADVFCLPSYREGFGTVVLEAAAMGVPCVGTKITGLQDAIVDGETGLLVAPRDVVALRNALLALLRDPAGRVRMGVAARRRVRERFDTRVIHPLLIEAYRHHLAGHAPAAGEAHRP